MRRDHRNARVSSCAFAQAIGAQALVPLRKRDKNACIQLRCYRVAFSRRLIGERNGRFDACG